MSTTLTGRVVSLQVCPGYRKPMQPGSVALAVENLGLRGDRHALKDSARQILLVENEILKELSLLPGVVKENITTEGIDLMALQRCQRIQIGNEVVLEITQACSPCSRMEEIRPGLMQQLARRRGMLVRVLKGGTLMLHDSIRVISE